MRDTGQTFGASWLVPGTSGYVLTSNGVGAAPSWTALPVATTTPFSDASALVKNAADNTKLAIFSAASIATGTTRTYTLPNVSGTLITSADSATVSNSMLVNNSVTISGHVLALGGSLSLAAGDVSLGNVTNDTQTKAAIVPNTVPSAGQIHVGNAGGTAFGVVSLSGSGATFSLASTGVLTVSAIANASLTNNSITIQGSAVALGGSTLATNSTPQFARVGLGAAADGTAGLINEQDGIGNTSTDGIIIKNATSAAAGAQQYSSRIHFIGQGWKTAATAASQTVDYFVELRPVQFVTNPMPQLAFGFQTNGLGYHDALILDALEQDGTYASLNAASALRVIPYYDTTLGGLPIIGTTSTTAMAFSQNGDNSKYYFLTHTLGGAGSATASVSGSGAFYIQVNTDDTGTNDTTHNVAILTTQKRLFFANNAPFLMVGSGPSTGSNIAGNATYLYGGQSTGTGLGGNLNFQVSPAGTSGSGVNALATALSIASTKIFSTVNGIATAGYGVPTIVAQARSTGQTGAVASVATYTPNADGTFEVSANVNVTASTTHSFNVNVTYTDETNTSRTLNLVGINPAANSGTLQLVANASGVAAYSFLTATIRVKASTAITILTSGTFTSVTYNVEGIIKQIA